MLQVNPIIILPTSAFNWMVFCSVCIVVLESDEGVGSGLSLILDEMKYLDELMNGCGIREGNRLEDRCNLNTSLDIRFIVVKKNFKEKRENIII